MRDKPFSRYQILSNAVMILWTILIILPFLLLLLSSVTDENTLVANGYSFFPKTFSLSVTLKIFPILASPLRNHCGSVAFIGQNSRPLP